LKLLSSINFFGGGGIQCCHLS